MKQSDALTHAVINAVAGALNAFEPREDASLEERKAFLANAFHAVEALVITFAKNESTDVPKFLRLFASHMLEAASHPESIVAMEKELLQ